MEKLHRHIRMCPAKSLDRYWDMTPSLDPKSSTLPKKLLNQNILIDIFMAIAEDHLNRIRFFLKANKVIYLNIGPIVIGIFYSTSQRSQPENITSITRPCLTRPQDLRMCRKSWARYRTLMHGRFGMAGVGWMIWMDARNKKHMKFHDFEVEKQSEEMGLRVSELRMNVTSSNKYMNDSRAAECSPHKDHTGLCQCHVVPSPASI